MKIPRSVPLVRSPIKKKRKKTKISWRSGKIRLDAKGMEDLRIEVYIRSGRVCENTLNGLRCNKEITWNNFEMHHLRHLSLGGSDSLENCVALCNQCHSAHHLKSLEIKPWEK